MDNQLSLSDRLYLQQIGRIRRFRKEWPVLHQGDQADAFFLIMEGEVEVSCQRGSQKTILCRLGEGQCFGELGLLTGSARTASVCTLVPSTFAVLNRQQFSDCLRDRPSLGLAMIGQLGAMVRDLTEKLNVNADDAYSRLRYFLYRLAEEEEGGKMVINNWTQDELAGLMNCGRETVSKKLSALDFGGWISRETNPKRIVILKELPKRF